MKVVIYSRLPPEATGGVERFVASLGSALRARGHVCDVIAGDDLDCRPDASVAEIAARMAAHWKEHCNFYDIGLFNKGEFGYKAHRGRTVVVFHGNSRGQVLATLGLQPLKSSVACFALGGHLQWLAGWKHTRVAVSQATRRDLTWLYGLPQSHVIQNGIDTAQFAPGNQREAREMLGLPGAARVFLYAARVEPLKCPGFLPIWSRNLKPDEHLLVATDKPMQLTGNVTALLNVAREKMPQLYQAADVALLPSYFEGCAYAVIEAMSCGCILVASPVGHARDIIGSDPVLAACFEPRHDALAFLKRARRLLDDPALADTLRRHERQYVLENNTLDRMAEQYEALFEQVLREQAG